MKTRQRIVLSILLVNLLLAAFALGQRRREINFPDILGYKTLKCDFHIHTVFSDGLVWPTVRVDEAPAQIELSYIARNFLIAPDKGLPVTLTIRLK